MTNATPLIKDILTEAIKPGPSEEPTALITALQDEAAPLMVFMRTDEDRIIENAIEQDFGFLWHLNMQHEGSKQKAMKRWTALIRWLLSTVKEWKNSEDKEMRALVAILLTSRFCGGGADLWHMLPEKGVPSLEFLDILSSFISKLQISYDVPETGKPPIWESEFVEAFQQSDAACDWVEIANKWQQFSGAVRSAPLFEEMVRSLARYGFERLVQATDSIQQCPPAMEIAHILSISQRLRLALATSSAHIQFCCTFTTVAYRTGTESLSSDDAVALSKILIKVSTSEDEWHKWMTAFNTYPLRYPHLYQPLGHALANVSPKAALTFINTIRLHPIRVRDTDESRDLISKCLRAFKQQAPLEQRQALWTSAYQRWFDWRFDKRSPDANLFEISRSELDYAVVSYMHECIDDKELENAFDELQHQLSAVELSWHSTETNYTTEWNRLLSLFQLYVHASKIMDTDMDALPDSRIYYPTDLINSLYYRIMFRIPTYQ